MVLQQRGRISGAGGQQRGRRLLAATLVVDVPLGSSLMRHFAQIEQTCAAGFRKEKRSDCCRLEASVGGGGGHSGSNSHANKPWTAPQSQRGKKQRNLPVLPVQRKRFAFPNKQTDRRAQLLTRHGTAYHEASDLHAVNAQRWSAKCHPPLACHVISSQAITTGGAINSVPGALFWWTKYTENRTKRWEIESGALSSAFLFDSDQVSHGDVINEIRKPKGIYRQRRKRLLIITVAPQKTQDNLANSRQYKRVADFRGFLGFDRKRS